MHETTLYDAEFYEKIRDTAIESARVIVPLVAELLRPASVIDIGSGTGSWASMFRELGINDVLCVDGAYVNRTELRVPEANFTEADVSKPLAFNRKFDLAVCLEVGEHLFESAADVLVDSITRHADAVLFSAGIPHQGGTHHVNLQWPAYWAEKFKLRGYRCFDCVRWAVWENETVAEWYKQNALVYLNDLAIARLAADSPVRRSEVDAPRSVVHPDIYLAVVGNAIRTPRVGTAIRTLVQSTTQSIQHRVGQIVHSE